MSFSDLGIKRIETSADTLTVELTDGRVLTVPWAYDSTLLHATDAERNNCQPSGADYGIEWPAALGIRFPSPTARSPSADATWCADTTTTPTPPFPKLPSPSPPVGLLPVPAPPTSTSAP